MPSWRTLRNQSLLQVPATLFFVRRIAGYVTSSMWDYGVGMHVGKFRAALLVYVKGTRSA